jgi:hypothetical protein
MHVPPLVATPDATSGATAKNQGGLASPPTPRDHLERETGFEPATLSLGS